MDSSKVSKLVAEEYSSSLSDLTINSKPLINMLTMLAEENREHAPAIVEAVEKHLQKVQSDIKLPVLYLIDSIVKNVGKAYVNLFTQNIVSTFCACFEKVDERTRAQMFKLRQTWNDVFPSKKLYAVDVRVSSIDPAWPITAPPPTSIHVNPKFFAVPSPAPVAPSTAGTAMAAAVANLGMIADLDPEPKTASEKNMRDELIRKQKELIELHQKKLTLEMMQTKAKLEEQKKQLEQQTGIARATQQLMASGTPSMQSSSDTAQLLAVQKFLEAATLNIAGVVAPVTPNPVANVQQQKAVTVAANSSAKAPAKAPTLPESPSKSVARTRDPRLLGRPTPQAQTVVLPQETDAIFDAVKLVQPAKPKPHITINLGCDIKKNVPNKEPRGVTKPRNISNKGSSVGSKAFPTSYSDSKGNGAKSKIPTPSVSSISTMKRIPKLKDRDSPKIINIDLTLASSPLNPTDDIRNSKENIVSKKSPNKVEKPKSRSSQPDKDKPNKKPIEKQKSKPDSPRAKKPDKKVGDVLKREKPLSKGKEESRERSKYDMIESEEDSPSPPPPPNISVSKKQENRSHFRDVKIKGRNYIRKRRGESRSRSPQLSDVDLRPAGPPEKQQTILPAVDTAKKPVVDNPLVSLDAGKDIDLRETPGLNSPGKKRSSSDREVGDQPPNKKSKAEKFDILFGNEDVDLRRIVGKSTRQPSPPPPPIISGQPLTIKISDSDERHSPPKPDSKKVAGKDKAPEVKGNGDQNPRDWSKFKGPKSPVVSSYLDRYPKKQGRTGKLDRLGRPHLFGRSDDDEPRDKRRRSGDTDMRPHTDDLHDESDNNIDMIMSQANEQIKSGQLSSSQYNTLLSQVVQLNETKKLREAKRRDEKWERRNSKSKSNRLDLSPVSDDGNSATFSPGSDGSDTNHRSGSSPPRKRDDDRYRAGQRIHRNPRGPNNGSGNSSNSNWPWQRPPNPWLHGQPGMGPMHHQQQSFIMPPSGDGNYRWRPPHQQPFMPMGPVPMGVPMGAVPMPMGPMVAGIRPIAQNMGPMAVAAMTAGSMPVGIPGFETDAPINNVFDPFAQQQQEEFPSQPPVINHDDMPLADPLVLDNIAKDTMRTINIDGHPREIRYYGDMALTMVSWDDPREVMFQRGTRRVMFDDRERDSITCSFNEPYRDFVIDGFQHKIRFGAPTRELWIDGKWYECYFGGPPVKVELGGKIRSVNLEGPPPQVKLGYVKRLDLCVGKINLIIDAKNMVPIFLDSKPQRFDIENKPHILRFINALTTVLINGRPFEVEFGGLPMPIVVRNKKHFIRFSGLPPGIRPGYVTLRNMEGGRLPSPPRSDLDANNLPNDPIAHGALSNTALPPPPAFAGGLNHHQPFNPDAGPVNEGNQVSSSATPSQGLFMNNERNGGQVPLDMLTSLMPTALAPSSGFDYQVDNESNSQEAIMSQPEPTVTSSETGSSSGGFLPFLAKDINIQELFQKLVATGIVAADTKGSSAPAVEPKKVEEEPKIVKHVEFRRIETLRARQPGMVAILYSGIQCSSCGVRFPPEETVKYSQHLDWHFRQNRRDRDNTRKAQSRKWYYDVSDWLQYEEIEDLDHRPQIWFDPQLETAAGEESNEPVVIPSVPVGENSENPFCVMCHDKFEQFYNEDSEEWHLKLAVRVDDKIYHPLCYEDFKSASYEHDETVEIEPKDEPTEEVAEVEIKMETDEKEVPKPDEDCVEPMETEIKLENEDSSPDLEEIEVTVKEEVKDPTLDLTTDDLTTPNLEDDLGRTEGQLVVSGLLDDVLESVELQLFGPRQVKLEPVDEKLDVTVLTPVAITTEEPKPVADTTHAAVVSSIDGNVQFEDSPKTNIAAAGSKIKINITKPLPAREVPSEVEAETTDKGESGDVVFEGRTVGDEDNEPPPPGVEETLLPETLKPKLTGRQLVVLPPVRKGSELSGLCSIM